MAAANTFAPNPVVPPGKVALTVKDSPGGWTTIWYGPINTIPLVKMARAERFIINPIDFAHLCTAIEADAETDNAHS